MGVLDELFDVVFNLRMIAKNATDRHLLRCILGSNVVDINSILACGFVKQKVVQRGLVFPARGAG